MPKKKYYPGYQRGGLTDLEGAYNPDGSPIHPYPGSFDELDVATLLRAKQRGPQGRSNLRASDLIYKDFDPMRDFKQDVPMPRGLTGVDIEDLINEELPPIGEPVGHGLYERIKGIQVPEHPLKRGLRGLGWLREKIKERLRERSARKFWEENPIEVLPRAFKGGAIPGYADGDMAADETTVTASTVNPAVGQQYADLTDRVVQEGQRPYQQYGGQRIAGFTGPEAIAQQGIVNYGMSGGPQGTQQAGGTMGQAGRMMGSAAQGIGSLMPAYGAMSGQFGGLGASMGDPAQQSGADMSNYMSQYTKGVTDPQLAQLAEFQKMQGEELGAQATASGNLGGMREGVQAGQIARDTSQQAADIIGKSQQDAFANAQQAFQADRAAKMAGQQNQLSAMGQQMGALGAQQGALQQMGALGSQMGGLGTRQAQLGQQQQAQQLQRLNAMQNVGAQQRGLQQQSMNMGYQDWQNQQNQNRQNIDWQMNAMGALPYQNIQARTDYTGVPSDLNAFLGAGVKGMTLHNQYKNGGSTGNGGQN